MPTATLPDIDTSVLDEVEFQVACDVTEAVITSFLNIPIRRCDRPAAFSALFPCCGIQAFSCEHHVKQANPWYCTVCKQSIDSIKMAWQRI